MKLADILNKMIGLDPNKEYDMSISEQNTTGTTPAPATEPTQETTQNVETPGQSSSSVEQVVDSVEVAQLRNEVENLKRMNQALLARTPIEESELSVEERIYNLVMPQKKGE